MLREEKRNRGRVARALTRATVGATLASALVLVGSGGGTVSAFAKTSAKSVAIATDIDPGAFGYDPDALSGGGETTFFDALYSSLFTTTPGGQVEGELVSTYSFNKAKTQLTLNLVPGVKFTDGTTLTSTLVKENLARRSDPTEAAYGAFAKGGTAEISKVTTKGKLTVVITFAKPEASAPSLLADDAGRIVGGKAIANPKMLLTTPDGSGPYILDTSKTVKASTYTLVRNPHSWDARAAAFSKIVMNLELEPQTRANALVSGQVQEAQLDATTLSAVGSKDKIAEVPGTIYGFAVFDKTGAISKPFGSVLVRRALMMAINRKQIAAAHLGAVPTASLFPPTTQGYDSALNSQYAYNPAKAKQLLAQAGYGSGFSFTVVTVGPQFAVDLQAIQAEWQQIGVNMTIQQATSFAQGLQSQATTPIGFNDLTVGRDPLGFVNGFLLGGSLNAQHAVDPKILKDLGIAESGTGDSDVTALKALDSTIINDGWFIPVYTQPTYIGYNPAVLAAPVSTGTNVYPQLPTPRS